MPARKSGPRRGSENTRERILLEAERLIALQGVDGLRLQDIAEAVGIRPPSVFAHFKGLPAIIETVFRRVLEDLDAAIATDPNTPPQEAIETLCTSVVDFLAQDPAHVRLMLQQFASGSATSNVLQAFPSGRTLVKRIEQRLDVILSAGQQAGLFRSISGSNFISFMLGGILTRLAWDEFEDWEKDSWPELLNEFKQTYIDLVKRYLAP